MTATCGAGRYSRIRGEMALHASTGPHRALLIGWAYPVKLHGLVPVWSRTVL